MTYEIILEQATLARLGSTVTLPLADEERVLLHFTSLTYSLGALAVTASNGDLFVREKTTGAPVDITDVCRRAGEVKITASLIVGGEIVKAWGVEGLTVREIENVTVVIPELESMRSDISLLRAAVTELNAKIEKITEM